MKKYRLITACLLILLALLLFNIFNRNRNSTIETFNADVTTKEEITDELVYCVDSSGNKELAGYEHLKPMKCRRSFRII